jgi:pimeloyl-ACP methyl ester carboxylesterase
MTEYRAVEVLAAVDSIQALNTHNIPELESLGLSFVGKLKTDEIHYMGHSFGAATALHAARQRPPTSILVHEPASEWIPDATRGSLFDAERLQASTTKNYTQWTSNVTDAFDRSVHDMDMLVLFSHEWDQKVWGGVDVLKDMYQQGLFGRQGGASRVDVIDGAHHSGFSDTCMLTPTWLAREVGITGPRSPSETARDIHLKTMAFLQAVQQQSL